MSKPVRHPKSVLRSADTGRVTQFSAFVLGPTKLAGLPAQTELLIVPKTADAEIELRHQGYKVWKSAFGGKIFTTAGTRAEAVGRVRKFAKARPKAEAFEPGPKARAILRGVEFSELDLKESGGAFDIETVRKLLRGVSRQAIDKKVNEGSLLAVPGPSGKRRFPVVQFGDDGTPLRGLKDVQAALGFSSPWSVLNFLVNPHDLLSNAKPADLLKRGEISKVVQAAMQSGVRSA
jgi:hypothetical protein